MGNGGESFEAMIARVQSRRKTSSASAPPAPPTGKPAGKNIVWTEGATSGKPVSRRATARPVTQTRSMRGGKR